jgi:hypothetical protein
MKHWRYWMVVLLVVSIGLSALPSPSHAQFTDVSWWLTGATLKVMTPATPPDDSVPALTLHAARGEYAPFQVVFQGGDSDTQQTVSLDFDRDAFDVRVLREQYLALPITPDPEIFTVARLNAESLPDGLLPLDGTTFTLDVGVQETVVLWIDVYVQPNAVAGDYAVTVRNGDTTQTATLTVYDVELPYTASMNILIPVEYYIMEDFSPDGDGVAFHRQVNQLLIDHYIIPGVLAGEPVSTADGWDFSQFDDEISQLPVGARFHTPIPYNLKWEEYYIENEENLTYLESHFGDPYFDEQLNRFFTDLATYLAAQDRLDGALVYPVDETVWVADEPWHDGPRGYEHLALWTQIIRNAGLGVRVSGVSYVPLGPTDLGWLDTATIADDTHVHEDQFDADPAGFRTWVQANAKRSASVYLNEYGDLIDMPAAIQRGMAWHVYGRGVRDIVGYAGMEWFDENYNIVDTWTSPEMIYPHSGYGGGALVWPGPYPSIRLKMLREGVEDARLLDVYASITSLEDAQNFARCLTPETLADQNPSPELWDNAHREMLVAISAGHAIDLATACPPAPVYEPVRVILDMESVGQNIDDWEFENSMGEIVATDKGGSAIAIQFDGELPYAGFYLDSQDWRDATALQVHIFNDSPFFSSFDVALSDVDYSYLSLRDGAITIGPYADVTITMPFILPIDYDEEFDWSAVDYISLELNTTRTHTNGFGERNTFSIGGRRLVFDDFMLVK